MHIPSCTKDKYRIREVEVLVWTIITDLRVSHLAPSHSDGHEQYPGCVQFPPFSHGGWQTATGAIKSP